MRVPVSLWSKFPSQLYDIFGMISDLAIKLYIKITQNIKKNTITGNIKTFLNSLRPFSMKKPCVPNAPFLRLISCHFLDNKWKLFYGTWFKVSKKLPKTIKNSCKKFCGPDFSHFCATPIWNCVPRHMTHPVFSIEK